MNITADVLETFRQKRRITDDGCWEWTGSYTHGGYGVVTLEKRVFRVTRVVAHFHHGLDIEDRKCLVRHKCDNPPCFNPDHLELGDHRDNARDMGERGRARPVRGYCDLGHAIVGDNARPTAKGFRCWTCYRRLQREMKARHREYRKVAS